MGRLFVSNLASDVNVSDLRQLFAVYGAVCGVTIARDAVTKTPRGFAHVEMASTAGTESSAKSLDGFMWKGRRLEVRVCATVVNAPVSRMGGRGAAIGVVYDRRRQALAEIERLFKPAAAP